VAAESGWVTVLQWHGGRLRVISSGYLADDAHVVAVDPATGRSFSPCSATPAATRPCWCARST